MVHHRAMRPKALVSWSSGKDSAFALHEVRCAGELEVVGLLTTVNRLTCVDPRALDRRFAGRAFDRARLAELPPGVDPCGEHGEFHTFVTGGPRFARPVEVTPGEVVERDGFVFADLTGA